MQVIWKKKQIISISILIVFAILGITSFFLFSSMATEETEEKDYIKWVDFQVTEEVLEKTAQIDITSHTKEGEVEINWIELIAYLAAKYGGNFKNFKQKDLDGLVEKLQKGESMEAITQNMKLYSYYLEAYTAILEEFIGEYEIEVQKEDGSKEFQKKYGIKAFLPIAKNYGFSHYDDFGAARSYGYKRTHLGNDLMGAIGTPIIAVESGVIEAARMESVWRLENRHS